MVLQEIENIAIVGAGIIGQGMAAEFALGGYPVRLHSRSDESLARAENGIREILNKMVALGVKSSAEAEVAFSHITNIGALEVAVHDAQIIFEAVYENLDLKREIFGKAEEHCPENAILVSGTSTISLSKITSGLSRPERVLLANVSNPSYLIPLIEVLRNEQTSDQCVDVFCKLLTKIGKKPAVIQKEVPGFVANRLQVALLREALYLIEQGVITAQDIDLIMRSSIGRRWAVAGIFEVFELAGQDLTLSASSYLMPFLDNAPQPSRVLRELVEDGNLGVKTGKGFYPWTDEKAKALSQRIAHALVEIERWDN